MRTRSARAGCEAVWETDWRVELIAGVEAAAGRSPCPRCPGSRYQERVREALGSSHPACRLFAEMTPSDWRHRHPCLILLDFSQPPGLAVEAHPEHYEGMGAGDALARFLPALRALAAEALPALRRSEEGFHERQLAAGRGAFAGLDHLGPIEDYLGGVPAHRYHFVCAPLYHGPAMHNVLYRRPGGLCDIYTIVGHRGVADGVPEPAFDAAELRRTAWHEIAHTVVDDITQSFAAELGPLSGLYALMTGLAKAKYQGPGGWLHMVDEHVIRAVTSRVAALRDGEAAGLKALDGERREGFALVGPLYEALKEYEASRARHPTLRGFYPRLTAVLSRLHDGLKAPRRAGP